jgi:hypothetical protein
VQFHQSLDERKSNTESSIGASRARVQLGEHVKNLIEQIWQNTDAIISHGKAQRPRLHGSNEGNLSSGGLPATELTAVA